MFNYSHFLTIIVLWIQLFLKKMFPLKHIYINYKVITPIFSSTIRLAKKYVYLAISGKSSDDIYDLAKNEYEKESKKTKQASGYIAKEDYENTLLRNTESMKIASENSVSTTFNFSQFSQQSHHHETSQDSNSSAIKQRLNIQHNPSLQNSSSKNNITSAALRENMDSNSARKMSAQKNFTGRDQSNISPYNSVEKNKSGKKTFVGGGGHFSGNSCGISTPSTFKVKRQISFDN